jgi:hypothetical protein
VQPSKKEMLPKGHEQITSIQNDLSNAATSGDEGN